MKKVRETLIYRVLLHETLRYDTRARAFYLRHIFPCYLAVTLPYTDIIWVFTLVFFFLLFRSQLVEGEEKEAESKKKRKTEKEITKTVCLTMSLT